MQADLKCFAALGVHGTCAVTAVTAQNTVGISAIHPVPPEVVVAQIEAVISDLRPGAAKTGMLGNGEVLRQVAGQAALPGFPPLVVDPALRATSGDRLLEKTAELEYLSLLFPLATVVTPNLAETAILVGRPVTSLEDMAQAARQLHHHGPEVVVIKGGHLGGSESVDVVFDGQEITLLSAPRRNSRNLAGTGCTFSAAITAYLALGLQPIEAITAAKHFVREAIEGSMDWTLGAGQGPLDPSGWTRRPG